MRVRQAGRICQGLWLLGREESCVYLLEGEKSSMLISAGMSYIIPDLKEQLQLFGIDADRISRLLILHAHFDHVGVVPCLKREKEAIELLASSRAWELLGTPKVLETINSFSKAVASRMGRLEALSGYDLEWRTDIAGEVLREGDHLDLGGLEVQIMETPGHSSCSISAWVPQLGALFASDAGGIPFKDTIITSGNSDFTRFQENLERFKKLPIKYVCADHYGYVCGEEAGGFMAKAAEKAAQLRREMEELYLETKHIEAAAKELTRRFYAQNPDYLLTPEIFQGVFGQMVRHVAAHIPVT
jgi:glyoxylase-like metal-dependent hydrolase (beta-lactamase superfamily II)